ncbi:hypothetical protein KC19_VG090300 [Ceratodon purpureus]|uniref:Uncharacterized protein n=1 Tax=Ceratodon purpureus TaxID=3225 RepID=A0A8T0HNI9_CERPU|nr:hypothetical protein KC19_VG090300 [Ceratodon purpureus]
MVGFLLVVMILATSTKPSSIIPSTMSSRYCCRL